MYRYLLKLSSEHEITLLTFGRPFGPMSPAEDLMRACARLASSGSRSGITDPNLPATAFDIMRGAVGLGLFGPATESHARGYVPPSSLALKGLFRVASSLT